MLPWLLQQQMSLPRHIRHGNAPGARLLAVLDSQHGARNPSVHTMTGDVFLLPQAPGDWAACVPLPLFCSSSSWDGTRESEAVLSQSFGFILIFFGAAVEDSPGSRARHHTSERVHADVHPLSRMCTLLCCASTERSGHINSPSALRHFKYPAPPNQCKGAAGRRVG